MAGLAPEMIGEHRFGYGTFFLLPFASPEEYTYENFRLSAHSAGCPVPGEIIDQRGLKASLARFDDLNFLFRLIIRVTRNEGKTSLAGDLDSPVRRRPGEPAGKFEVEAVPLSYLNSIAPAARVAGFSLSRMLEAIHQKQSTTIGLPSLIRDILPDSHTSYHLTAYMAQQALARGVSEVDVFRFTFGKNLLTEQNCQTDMQELAWVMKQPATSTVWERYQRLMDNSSPLVQSQVAFITP
jgi:hypothetical protein